MKSRCERHASTVLIEAQSAEAVKEFCWGNHEMLCENGAHDSTIENNAVIAEAGDAWEGFPPDVRLNALQRVQDV